MTQIADSIVTSHKMAAKRATVYLERTRKLKLKPTEALELVAQVLGAANWKTLLGMAQQGKTPGQGAEAAPSFSYTETSRHTKPAESAGTDEARLEALYAEKDEALQRQLEEYYTTHGDGEHPDFPKEDFEEKADEGMEYWEWVLEEMCDRADELPWERDAMPEYQVATAAGITLNVSPDNEWFCEGPEEIVGDTQPHFFTEAAAWRFAAARVNELGEASGLQWGMLPFHEQIAVLERRFCLKKPDGSPQHMNRIGFDLFDEWDNICKAANMHPSFVATISSPDTWTTLDGKTFTDKPAALAHQVSLIKGYLVAKVDSTLAFRWDWLTEKTKVKFALGLRTKYVTPSEVAAVAGAPEGLRQ